MIVDDEAQLAGIMKLEHIIRGASQSATVSYWVDHARNGRGLDRLAVAAVAELTAVADLDWHRLQAPIRVGILASQRVLEKNGFGADRPRAQLPPNRRRMARSHPFQRLFE